MSTTTIPAAAKQYLEEVREGLADLPDEDAEEILQDLEAHLAEIGDTPIEPTLGTPGEFVAEFRASAGLDSADTTTRPGWLSRQRQRSSARLDRVKDWAIKTLGPVLGPLARHRQDIRTAWIWTRGILVVVAFMWFADNSYYGDHRLLGSNLLAGLVLLSVATFVSVQLARASTPTWRRLDLLVSIGAGLLIVVAIGTSHFVPYPEEQAYFDGQVYIEGQEYFTPGGREFPVLLIGPNGPIQNLYAYDTAGNPVEVLLYDEFGNPILTLPSYAYNEAADLRGYGEPFVWEGFEIRFQDDTYGRPVGNLYPLDRYEWTGTGARSAPRPPPVVGIPSLPDLGQDAAVTSPAEPPPTTEAPPATTLAPTSTPFGEVPATTEAPTTTEPPTTTTQGG